MLCIPVLHCHFGNVTHSETSLGLLESPCTAFATLPGMWLGHCAVGSHGFSQQLQLSILVTTGHPTG